MYNLRHYGFMIGDRIRTLYIVNTQRLMIHLVIHMYAMFVLSNPLLMTHTGRLIRDNKINCTTAILCSKRKTKLFFTRNTIIKGHRD